MTTKNRAVACGLASIATLAVACSSADTKNDYVDTVNAIQSSALQAFNQTASSTPKNQAALVQQLRDGEAALADAVSELEAVEVPEEAQESHPELVAGIEDLRDLFADTADKVEAGDENKAFSALTALGSEGAVIGDEIDQAISNINEDLGAD